MVRQRVLISAVLISLCSPYAVLGTPLWDTLSQGAKLFSQFLNFNPDSPIAPLFQFVSERLLFHPSPKKGDPGERQDPTDDKKEVGPWGTLFRTLGWTSSQMSAFSVDLLIFLAQMVNNAFSANRAGKRRGKNMQKPLIETIIEQPRISRMLSTMQDPKLMENVLLEVDGRLSDADNDCPQQLLCRLSPFVKGMQTSLAFFLKEKIFQQEKVQRGDPGQQVKEGDESGDLAATWRSMTPLQRLLFFMPSFEDFTKETEPCRKRYPRCASY